MLEMKEKIHRDADFMFAEAIDSEHREAVALETLGVYPLGDPDVEPRIITARELLAVIQSSVTYSMVTEDFEYRYLRAVDDVCENGELSRFDARVVRCAAGLDGVDWAASAAQARGAIQEAREVLYDES